MVIAWSNIQSELNKNYSNRGYLAPTIYLLAKKDISAWNYYDTFDKAKKKWDYLRKLAGGSNVSPSGSVSFTRNAPQAQTIGINVDFYIPQSPGVWVPVAYATMKDYYEKTTPDKFYCIAKFYPTNGKGPYFILMDKNYMGISATSVNTTDAKKLAELDGFHREVQLLKYRYNSLVAFLTELSKKDLTAKQQQIFNEGLLLKSNLESQIRGIKGIEITYATTGQINGIGVAPLLVIAIIAIIAAATAWTVYAIATEREKTKRINDGYDVSKWVTTKMQEVAKDPNISQADKTKILNTLKETSDTASNVVQNSSENTKSVFGEIGDIAKFGLIFLFGIMAMNYLPKPKTKTV